MQNSSYPIILDDIHSFILATLDAEKINITTSEKIARHTVEKIRHNWGGQQVYIPVGRTLKAQQLQVDIIALFNGKNHAELSKRFGISLQRVYQIIKQNQQH